jgi:hypothetical protein
MNTIIKKFWEDAGYEVSATPNHWIVYKDSVVGIESFSIYFAGKYKFKGQLYSEKEMLKLIKHKAFSNASRD